MRHRGHSVSASTIRNGRNARAAGLKPLPLCCLHSHTDQVDLLLMRGLYQHLDRPGVRVRQPKTHGCVPGVRWLPCGAAQDAAAAGTGRICFVSCQHCPATYAALQADGKGSSQRGGEWTRVE